MYYFENDPLAEVHHDLAQGKPLTHFDNVMLLKGIAKAGFNTFSSNDFRSSSPKPGLHPVYINKQTIPASQISLLGLFSGFKLY